MIYTAIFAASGFGVVIVVVWAAIAFRRDAIAATRGTILAEDEAQTIKNLKTRKEVDAEVNADADLVARARRVMHHDDPAK